MRQLLITGVTGCIGRAVTHRAQAAGWRVRGLARRPPSTPLDRVEFVLGEVEDDDCVARAVEGCTAVVHLAGYVHQVPRGAAEEAALRRSIIDGTRHVAARARATEARLVNASTVAVYGACPAQPCTEHTLPRPDTPYARAKLEAELLVATIDPAATSLRIALVFGPYDRGNLAKLLRAVERGLPLIVGDGANRKSVVYVENLAERMLLAVDSAAVPGAWIAADTPAPTQRELVTKLAAALGRRPPLRVPQAPLEWAGAALDGVRRAAGRAPRWRDRVRKLAAPTEFAGAALDARLGTMATVDLAEGLRRTVTWYREQARA